MPIVSISTLAPPSSRATQSADAYLSRQHNMLASYHDLGHFVWEGEDKLRPDDFKKLSTHLMNLRIALARLLWKHEIYIGVSILDEFIFNVAKSGKTPVLAEVLAQLARTAAGQAGFVVYPVHGLGFDLPPLLRKDRYLQSHQCFKRYGMALSAQTGSLKNTHAKLNTLAKSLGIQNKIDFEDLLHHSRAGNLIWLTRNPLMIVNVASHTGEYYENQFVYTLKVRLSATLVLMVWALLEDKTPSSSRGHLDTSASVNNWQTLDVRHYLVGEARRNPEERIELRRIPMNVEPLDLAHLSDVSVSINTKLLKNPQPSAQRKRLEDALQSIEQGYMSNVNMGSGQKLKRRVYSRLVKALDWYRRSFGSRQTVHERTVALAVAFETMLTDYYANGTDKRLLERVAICLKGRSGLQSYQDAVVSIVHLRNEILHTGNSSQNGEIVKAQAAFALCFIEIVDRLKYLPTKCSAPIEHVLKY